MRFILPLLLAIPLLSTARPVKPEAEFRINGILRNFPAHEQPIRIRYGYKSGAGIIEDSAEVKSGRFEIRGIAAEPLNLYLGGVLGEASSPGGYRISDSGTNVFVSGGTVELDLDGSFSRAAVKGSAVHDEYLSLRKLVEPEEARLKALYQQSTDQVRVRDFPANEKTWLSIDSLRNFIDEGIYARYIHENPSSPIALYVLDEYAGIRPKVEKVRKLFSTLSPDLQQLPSAIAMTAKLDATVRSAVGQKAIEFTQPDTLGHPVSLASFRGKYVLLEFWASWCGPCRSESPNVVKVYEQFRSQGFDVLGISLDTDRDRWLKAIREDRLPWQQVSDLKNWYNEVASMYGVYSIPQNVLIDPAGNIIARDLVGGNLEIAVRAAVTGSGQSVPLKKAF